MDSKPEISRLYDFYGELIPEAQQRVIQLYVNDDLSLSEVADILSISRQGVRDALSRATKKLKEYERQLKLAQAYDSHRRAAQAIACDVRAILSTAPGEEIAALCDKILTRLDDMIDRED